MIIKPYTDADVLSLCANPTAANFPCLKHFWHQDDITTGDTSWVDRIAGTSLNVNPALAGSFIKTSNGVYASNLMSTSVTGTFHAPGAYQFAIFVVGVFGAASVPFMLGDTGGDGPGIDVRGGAAGYILRDASNYLTSAAISADSYPLTGAMLLHADTDSDNEARKYACTSAGVLQATTKSATVGTIASTWPALASTAEPSFAITTGTASGFKICGLLVFEAVPTDLSAATQWMAMNPGYIYPGFLGRQ